MEKSRAGSVSLSDNVFYNTDWEVVFTPENGEQEEKFMDVVNQTESFVDRRLTPSELTQARVRVEALEL